MQRNEEEPRFLDPFAPLYLMRARWKWALLVVATAMEWARFCFPAPDGQQLAFWDLIFLLAITVVANEYIRPKPRIENARPKGLGDFSVPTATEGRDVPLVWGRVKLSGPNVVWYGDLSQDPIVERIKTGLWSKKRVTTGFQYRLGQQLGLCRGPLDAVKRVWLGEVEVFSGTATTSIDIDLPELFGGNDLGAGGFQATLDLFLGSTTQATSDYLERFQDSGAGTNRTPRYTGSAFVVARELGGSAATARGAYLGNSTQVKPIAFEVERFPALFSGQSVGDNIVGGTDCNLINVAYEVFTNTEWGYGYPAADIDVGMASSFLAASDTLIAEGNGFSMVLDAETKANEFIREIERQMEGVFYLDHRTGKIKCKLARNDYTLGSVPQLTDDNTLRIDDFSRGSWEDTTNQVTVQYFSRTDDYKESFAIAQDMGNALIRGDGTVSTMQPVAASTSFPGVKSGALATNLAWRELRGQSYPLARATVTVDRTFWDLTIGSVVAWTTTRVGGGFTQLPMRVSRINYGQLEDNRIVLTLVQDVFRFAAASYGTPPGTGWTPPGVSLVAYPAAQQLAMECPRGILVRDPEFIGDDTASKVFVAARRQGGETAFDVGERNSAGTPSGTFAFAGTATGFMLIGELSSSLAAGTAVPTSAITIEATPDSQARLEAAFDDAASLIDLGQFLVGLVLIDDEFMLVRTAAVNGSDVDLQSVYRGVLDSAQAAHAAGAKVYLVFVGASVTDTSFPSTNNVDIELRMRSAQATFAGTTTVIGLTMAKRPLRPYLPSEVSLNGTRYGTPSLEGAGSGLNGFRIDVTWLRRRFNTTDELTELLADQAVDASTEYEAELRADPNGANTLIETKAWVTGTGPESFTRARILQFSPSGAVGALLRLKVRSRHDIGAETNLVSRQTLVYDFTPTSGLTGQFAFGVRAAGAPSATYTAAATGTFTLNIGAAYSTSAVQVSINGGGFATVISAGNTTGTFSASSTDTIRVQHTVNETPSPNAVELKNPSNVAVAYGIFTT